MSKNLIDKVNAVAETMYEEWFSGSPHPDPKVEASIKRTYVAGFRAGYIYARTGKIAKGPHDQPS